MRERALLSCGKRTNRARARAQRFASESARVCFEDEWQPMRSRRCANEQNRERHSEDFEGSN